VKVTTFRLQYKTGGWKPSRNCPGPFSTLQEALDSLGSSGDRSSLYRVVKQGAVKAIWEGTREQAHRTEGVVMTDLLDQGAAPAPLNLDRAQLIAALQEKADAEKAKREAEQAKLDEARKEAIDAISAFSPQELYEIFRANFTTSVEDLTRYHDEERYVPKPVQAGKAETDLERAIRVLNLAADKTVEVRQGSDLYSLL
jgi:hypothetical protein